MPEREQRLSIEALTRLRGVRAGERWIGNWPISVEDAIHDASSPRIRRIQLPTVDEQIRTLRDSGRYVSVRSVPGFDVFGRELPKLQGIIVRDKRK